MPMPPPPQLMLLPLLAAAVAAAHGITTRPSVAADDTAPAAPTPWPEQFHAVMFTNLTESGGRLQLIDLYYDWPRARNLNLIRNQLKADDPLYDVEWTNGTSFIFDSASCRTIRFPVGILPPSWLAGATYLGRQRVDGFDCHAWTKVDFVWYFEEVATGRPVRWNFFNGKVPCHAAWNQLPIHFFNGMQQHVMSFEVGGVLEDSKWQAPAHCFKDADADDFAAANVAGDRVDDVMSSLIRLAGAPAAAVSF